MIQLLQIDRMRTELPQIFWLAGFEWIVGNKKATTVLRPIAVTVHHKDRFISPILKNGTVNWHKNYFKWSGWLPIYAFSTEQEAKDHYLSKVNECADIVKEELQKELNSLDDTRDRYLKL